jgi:hypothetical protein
MIFLSFSILYWIMNKTYAYPILLFIFSLPIIFGIGIIGFSKGLGNTFKGIEGILIYIIITTDEIYELVKRNEEDEGIKRSEIGKYVGHFVVLPAVKIWMNTKLFGRLIYGVIEKSSVKAFDLMEKESDFAIEENKEEFKTKKINAMIFSTVQIAKGLFEKIRKVCIALSVLGIIIGSILLVILTIINL